MSGIVSGTPVFELVMYTQRSLEHTGTLPYIIVDIVHMTLFIFSF